MVDVQQLETFATWLRQLRDRRGAARIAERIRRLSAGAFGDVKPVGSGVSELRVDVGPGYRVYFCRKGDAVIILLCGGDKASQARDIERALELAAEVRS